MCKMAHFGNCDPETADQEYCIFHKPNKSEEEAVEFYRKFLERFKPRVEEIEVNGQKIKRLVFEEPVDASGYVFPEIPNELIEYNGWKSTFSFEWAVFKKKALFRYANFKQAYLKSESLSMIEELFDEEPLVELAFQGNSDDIKAVPTEIIPVENFLGFEYAQFKDIADFERAEFDIARFLGAQFNRAIFENAKFQYADFLLSKFNLANFNWAIFEDVAIFEDAQFKIAQFMESRFNEGNFTRAQFEKAYFSDETIAYPGTLFTIHEGWTEFKKGDFRGAKFGEIYFEKVKVLEHLTFKGAVITERAMFIDSKDDVSSLLDEKCLRNKGWKTSNIHNSFEVCTKRFCHPQPLAEVAKLQRITYERLGDRENADKMFVLEMRAKRKLRKFRLSENAVKKATSIWGIRQLLRFQDMLVSWLFNSSNTWNELLKLSIAVWLMLIIGLILALSITVFQFLYLLGYIAEVILGDWVSLYGTSWERVLGASFLVIFGSAGGFWIGQKFGLGTVCLQSSITSTGVVCEHHIHTFKDALYYSLVTFTTLGYGDMHPTGWLKALSAIEALTGAVFMALIVAVIARKWMR